MSHPLHDVAVVGVHNTRQARALGEHDDRSIAFEAAMGAVVDAGLSPHDVDGVVGAAGDFAYQHRIGPVWRIATGAGILAVLEAAAAIAMGFASVVVISGGGAGNYADRSKAAPWTRPANEFVAPFGMFTAAEFALVARVHMHRYGTTPEALATVAAVIRNNGHINPGAVYFGRGPFTADDVLASRMIADPFHLLDCAMTSEGGSAVVIARGDIARSLGSRSVWLLGGGADSMGPPYQHPPAYDLGGRRADDEVNGLIGRRAATRAFEMCGLGPEDVDVCEFYDPFSFEIIRQFEAFGFCEIGAGGDFVLDGNIAPDGRYPVTTDGGTMSFSHAGGFAQMLQRVVRSVEQVRGECQTAQVDGATVAMCSNGGAGAMFNDVLLLGGEPA